MINVTTNEIQGARIKVIYGMVEGVSAEFESMHKNRTADFESSFDVYLNQRQKIVMDARNSAVAMLNKHAASLGANGIVGIRYAITNTTGSIEVIAYGTAVLVELTDVEVEESWTDATHGTDANGEPNVDPNVELSEKLNELLKIERPSRSIKREISVLRIKIKMNNW